MNIIVWALLTGLITGGVWIGIIVLRHQHELDKHELGDVLDMERRLAELEREVARIPELEERMEFAERLLASQRDPVRLPAAPPNQMSEEKLR